MKRKLSTLLAVLMLLSAIVPGALAASFQLETTVEPQYEDASQYSEDLAAVKKNGKWGYIDKEGNMVISPQFDLALTFNEGVAVVGYLREEILYDSPATYYQLCLLDKDGTVTELMEDQWGEQLPQTYYVNDWNSPIETVSQTWFCQNGVVNVNGTPYTADGKQIMVDTAALDKNWDFYEMTGPCVNGVIPMRGTYPTDGPAMQCFFMDKNGNVTRKFPAFTETDTYGITCVYAPEQDRIVAYRGYYSSEDWAWTEGGWGAMDLNGNWKVQPVYSNFRYMLSGKFFCDGNWTVINSSGQYGTVDKNGNTVIPFAYDFLSSFSEGMIAAQSNGSFFFLDQSGKRYDIGDIAGGMAGKVDAASLFNGGVTAVYQADTGLAYCIQNVPQGSVLPAIPGTENLDYSVYFPSLDVDGELSTILPPSEYIVIQENGKYGFAHMTFHLDLPDESAMDSWAYDEVCKAIEAGLVPNELQNQYRSNITRADFGLLMTEVATTITGKDLDQLVLDTTGKSLDEWVASYPFTDTTDRNVIAANALGIINGRGNGVFDPYASIERQEAAAMLLRAAVAIKADAMEGWADKIEQSSIQFSDGAAFAPYAQEAIEVMAALDVMKGTGNNMFSPTETYTRQQSFMTVYRLMVQILEEAA